MACTLSNKCAKNLSKRTVLLQLIIKNVVTCFFGTQCIVISQFDNLDIRVNYLQETHQKIGERYRLNHAVVVKLYHIYTPFQRNVSSAMRDFFGAVEAHRDFFDYCDLFLLTNLLNYLWRFYEMTSKHVVGKVLLQGRECYKIAI